MLSTHEQRIWDEIERCYAAEVAEPVLADRPPARRPGRGARGVDEVPAAVVACAWIAILLVIFGAPVAGLAVGTGTALGWALRRYWPRLGSAAPAPVHPGADEPWHRRSRHRLQNPPEEGRR